MRTTLNVDDDILLAAKEIAAQYNISLGKALSNLARQAFTQQTEEMILRNGVPLFPKRPDSGIVTPELVNRLRDDAP